MEKREKDSIINFYRSPDKSLWKGRTTDHPKPQYWYQVIKCIDLNEQIQTKSALKNIGIIGYACDEGVRRNQGRVGAANSPVELRKKLAAIPLHFENKSVFDFGDVICHKGDMEASQLAFSNYISSLLTNGVFPIAIGGGHDIAYGHFTGIRNALKDTGKAIGIINFDAHFDLRPFQKQGNSGTPFHQIQSVLEKENQDFNYLVLGIQQQSNTGALFEIADQFGVDYILSEDCHLSKMDHIKNQLKTFTEANDVIYLTIDMDGFSSAYAPGVSAPSSLGFSPHFVYEVLKYLFKTGKVISCDIAELNPEYDIDGKTAKLAAKLVDFIVQIC